MLPKTRAMAAGSPVPGAIPDRVTGSVSDGAAFADAEGVAPPQPSTAHGPETRSGRLNRNARGARLFRRDARRAWLHGSAIATVALVAYLIALAASNTARVKVSWVFGTSHVPLVWLVLSAAVLGWLLGLVATAAMHRRTRTPRRRGGATS